jgi:hypothetical protein
MYDEAIEGRIYKSASMNGAWLGFQAAWNAKPAAQVSEAVDNRRCKPCASVRGGDTCWKCGAETFTPDRRCGEEPRLPPIDRIRALAKEVGYAIGVHGSQQRDFDVIAAPWTDSAIGNHALLQHIAAGLTTENGPAHILSISRKPLGRYAATIQMDGWYKQLDISVCPNEVYEQARKESEMTIHAFTELRSTLPAYINVSERVSDPRDVIVTVRSSGENDTSTIILSRDQLRKMAEDIGKFLDPAAAPATPSDTLIRDLVKLWDSPSVSEDDHNEEMCRIEDAMRKAAAPQASQPEAAPKPNADCSGDPSCCPDNEGYGCACSPAVVAQDADRVATKLPNGVCVQNVYEAYDAGLEEAARSVDAQDECSEEGDTLKMAAENIRALKAAASTVRAGAAGSAARGDFRCTKTPARHVWPDHLGKIRRRPSRRPGCRIVEVSPGKAPAGAIPVG